MLLAFLVGGARPNFMKIAPLYRAFRQSSIFEVRVVSTGQHYDEQMAGQFFRDLGLPEPAVALSVGSGTHAVQTARVLERFEEALLTHQPALVVVVGDINSTLACALAAAKVVYADGRKPLVAHVEAGLRSFDREMPEEVNRVLTDAISDFLFATEPAAVENLTREGCDRSKIVLAGNVMIDTLLDQVEAARELRAYEAFDLAPGSYGVVTLHRPSNVNDTRRLGALLAALDDAAQALPLIFPVHPRTRARLNELDIPHSSRLVLCDPQAYRTFLSLLADARLVLTDSGGIQEETTILGVPCLTLRANTERPITIQQGTNQLVGVDPGVIAAAVSGVLSRPMPSAKAPDLWDGAAAGRIVAHLEAHFAGTRVMA